MTVFKRFKTVGQTLYSFFRANSGDESYWMTRELLLRGLGVIYFFVFFPLSHQYQALLGEQGLLPVSLYLNNVEPFIGSKFWDMPTLMWWSQGDVFALTLIYLGLGLSCLVILGMANGVIMAILWLLQLSFMTVGQTFWSFGWESNLLELGFLAIFLCPFWKRSYFCPSYPPAKIMIWFYRWTLFRLMLGSGLIKLRGDPCWWDLSCLMVHYETQPIPNPLSPFFHFLPESFHKLSVMVNHVVELVLPWFIFAPYRLLRIFAGICFVLFQFAILLGGNFAWINYLTLVMIIPMFDDRFFAKCCPFWKKACDQLRFKNHHVNPLQTVVLVGLSLFLVTLSIRPALNLIEKDIRLQPKIEIVPIRQAMNRSYDAFHIVNSYGVFGSITKERYELVFKGTTDEVVTPATTWLEYEFPCKPGDLTIMPCVRSPYHYRITWQLWFAAMRERASSPWLLHLTYKLLKGETRVQSLLAYNPFATKPPTFIKIDRYRYRFSNPYKGQENWYERAFSNVYLPPMRASDPRWKVFINERFPLK